MLILYNVRIRTRLWIYGQIYPSAFRSSLRLHPRELLQTEGYIWPYNPPLVLIWIQSTIAFSITKKNNIEILLLYYCSLGHVYFLVLPQQSSQLGLYGPVLLHLLGNTGKYSPICQTNTENQLFQYCPTQKDNTGSITFRKWECLYYDSSRDIRWNISWALGKSLGLPPRDFTCAQAIFQYRIVIIQIQYPSVWVSVSVCCQEKMHPGPSITGLRWTLPTTKVILEIFWYWRYYPHTMKY